jgi:hypothetical protein
VRFLAAVLLGAALVGLAPPAQAESWTATDRRSDVRATSIQLDTRGASDDCSGPRGHRVRHDQRRDVLGLAVDHTSEAVVLTLAMRDVAGHDMATTYELHLQTPRDDYALELFPTDSSGEDEVFFSKEPDYPDPGEIEGCEFVIGATGLPCEGLTGTRDIAVDQIVVTVPRGCLRNPNWVRAAAEVRGYTRPTASGRFVVYSDFWSRPGGQQHGFLPPFGPTVAAS